MFAPVTLSALLDATGNLAFSLSRVWAWVMLMVTGVRPEIRGREKIRKGRSYIIITNHQSHFDALALVTTLNIQLRWIAKKELLKVPLFGHALYASRNIFIDRSDNGSRKVLPRGSSVFHPGSIEVVIGDPIDTDYYTAYRVDELVKKTRDIIISDFNPDGFVKSRQHRHSGVSRSL